jgi:alkylation response protein AidB-like acyl-CoA dehydrogenase
MALAAARMLTRAAACAFETDSPGSLQRRTAIARHSAHRAALDAVQTGHQVFGAVGITLEGPAFFITRRIRGLAAQLFPTVDPGDALGATHGRAR